MIEYAAYIAFRLGLSVVFATGGALAFVIAFSPFAIMFTISPPNVMENIWLCIQWCAVVGAVFGACASFMKIDHEIKPRY